MKLFMEKSKTPLIRTMDKMLNDLKTLGSKATHFEMTVLEMELFIKEIDHISQSGKLRGTDGTIFTIDNSNDYNFIVDPNEVMDDFTFKRLVREWSTNKRQIEYRGVLLKQLTEEKKT